MDTMLFTPIELGPVTIPNRIAVPPMCMYSAKSGVAQLFHKMIEQVLEIACPG